MIKALSHITFIVKNLEKSTSLFMELFNGTLMYNSNDKYFSYSKEVFIKIGDIWIVLMEGNPVNIRDYNHIAFKINDDEFDKYYEKINKLGLEIKESRIRIDGEGRSIYFYDYDNHLIEIHSGDLSYRIEKYKEFTNKM